RILPRGFGQQLCDVSLIVGLDLPEALRLARKCAATVQVGVVIDLEKWLQGNPQKLRVMHHAVMVIRNSPRARIDVQILVEFALLRMAAELRVAIAAPQCPVSTARPG